MSHSRKRHSRKRHKSGSETTRAQQRQTPAEEKEPVPAETGPTASSAVSVYSDTDARSRRLGWGLMFIGGGIAYLITGNGVAYASICFGAYLVIPTYRPDYFSPVSKVALALVMVVAWIVLAKLDPLPESKTSKELSYLLMRGILTDSGRRSATYFPQLGIGFTPLGPSFIISNSRGVLFTEHGEPALKARLERERS
jgi:hypothetical protein